MARPKAFEPDQALDAAMGVFWAKGFEATSVADLVEATGVNRASLYGTFGDKDRLFLASLQRYCDQRVETMIDRLERPGLPLGNIRAVFESIVDRVEREGDRRGCFLCNSAVELGQHDPAVRGIVEAHLRAIAAGFEDALMRAQVAGDLPVELDAPAVALTLASQVNGLRVFAKAGFSPAELRRIAETTLGLIGA